MRRDPSASIWAYPAILLTCLIGNLVLFHMGTGVLPATYLPVTLGTLLIMVLDATLPYRSDWRPSRVRVVQDSTFLALAFVVREDVLSLYFVWYAVNGFFQHSNVDVRLGWLNYVVSGPELHRWHHSMQKGESNHNYGNHLLVWDVVFGSRYLPADRSMGALGLVNWQYPRDFLDQMAAPFTPGLDKQTV